MKATMRPRHPWFRTDVSRNVVCKCDGCGVLFAKKRSQVKAAKEHGWVGDYCSRECFKAHQAGGSR